MYIYREDENIIKGEETQKKSDSQSSGTSSFKSLCLIGSANVFERLSCPSLDGYRLSDWASSLSMQLESIFSLMETNKEIFEPSSARHFCPDTRASSVYRGREERAPGRIEIIQPWIKRMMSILVSERG